MCREACFCHGSRQLSPERHFFPMLSFASRSRKRKQPVWVPGKSADGIFSKGCYYGNNLGDQACQIIANCLHNLRSLPLRTQKDLQGHLSPVGCTDHTSLAAQILSGLTRIAMKTIEYVTTREFSQDLAHHASSDVAAMSLACIVQQKRQHLATHQPPQMNQWKAQQKSCQRQQPALTQRRKMQLLTQNCLAPLMA